jgi:hypothetical protein
MNVGVLFGVVPLNRNFQAMRAPGEPFLPMNPVTNFASSNSHWKRKSQSDSGRLAQPTHSNLPFQERPISQPSWSVWKLYGAMGVAPY